MNFPTLDFFKYSENKFPQKYTSIQIPGFAPLGIYIEHCVAAFVHVAVGQKDNERPTTS